MTAPFVPRLFHDGPIEAGAPLDLDADAAHHLLRVLRLAEGAPVALFNGDGRRWPARIVAADRRRVSVLPGDAAVAGTESRLAIVLAQALPAGDKMDWIVEKATELGAVAIQPLLSRRALPRLDAARTERRLAHWRRIAIAACMQCGRDRLPAIAPPRPLANWLAEPGAGLRLLLAPTGGTTVAALAAEAPAAVSLLVGPEGGFDDDEAAAALAAGWQALRLGPRTLRTETAGLVAIAALHAVAGDFRDT